MTNTTGKKQEDNDSDKILLFCADCETEFWFDVTDVVFSQLQGLNNIPKRCEACEAALLLIAT